MEKPVSLIESMGKLLPSLDADLYISSAEPNL